MKVIPLYPQFNRFKIWLYYTLVPNFIQNIVYRLEFNRYDYYQSKKRRRAIAAFKNPDQLSKNMAKALAKESMSHPSNINKRSNY